MFLPEAPEHESLLVLFWREPGCCPLMLLVSPQARRPGRTGVWFVRAFRRRWGVEDATWGIKQRFHLEQFLVRSWRSIRRLIYLVALAFFWLNLWGQDRYKSLRDAFLSHPWRLLSCRTPRRTPRFSLTPNSAKLELARSSSRVSWSSHKGDRQAGPGPPISSIRPWRM